MQHPKPLPPNLKDIDPSENLAEVGGTIDRAIVTLRLFGELLVPEEVTHLLGCQPTSALRKGDVIPDSRYHRVAGKGSWLLESTLPQETEIEQHVIALLSQVTSDLTVWQRLAGAYAVDICCGLFLECWNRGFSLSPRVLAMLAERGLIAAFDIYFVPRAN